MSAREHDELLTRREAAKVLRIGTTKLDQLLKIPPEEGGLDSVLEGPQTRRIPRSAINEHIAFKREQAAKARRSA